MANKNPKRIFNVLGLERTILFSDDINFYSNLSVDYGKLYPLKGEFIVLNIRVSKVPSLIELKAYLDKNKINYDSIHEGNPSPSIGFSVNSQTSIATFYNFYCPRSEEK